MAPQTLPKSRVRRHSLVKKRKDFDWFTRGENILDLRNGDGSSQRKQSCRSKNTSDPFPSSKFQVFPVFYSLISWIK
ncbi:hypothetical protein OPV22_025422 [Ensete ventricosum]|uniref:Uncharacterized protein n=1 Tax=Ensete ventricosum TaxID=4639 RepID=A0AAV8QJ77_ENSVE|nr:hypothetical protein OPV22_025422 [Ensete ventricosum]